MLYMKLYKFVLIRSFLKGVKKVRSAIKLCSFYFSYYVSNDINVKSTHLTTNKQWDVYHHYYANPDI